MKKAGRQPRDENLKRHVVSIKLTPAEFKIAKALAGKYAGNLNKLFRVKILGEKE